jgi:opacity protein-like surface antigen
MLAVPALAGTSQVMTESYKAPMEQDSTWQWFVGGTGGYLLDYEEDMYTFQLGAKSPWSFSGWSVAMFAEVGWTENHDGLDADLDIIPLTFNVKLERLISGGLGVYVGGGLGASYLDADFSAPSGSDHDWVFTGQVFAGLAYHVNDNLELFGGARWIYFDDPDFAGVTLDDDVLIEGGLRFYF